MADEDVQVATVRRRRSWPARIALVLLGLVVAALLAIAAGIAFLDTGPGHRFIADRIAQLAPSSGLRIKIGRIEGSIWGNTRLRDVRLYDPNGLFVESPLIEVKWHPAAWLSNSLSIDNAHADLIILHRIPKLRPSARKGPILPGFDIRIGHLRIDQLRVAKAVTGTERIARLVGDADIRSGRAIVHLNAAVKGSGERLQLALDAEPDAKKFDVDVHLNAPANSVTGAILGTKRPIQLAVEGSGNWTRWAGSARLSLSARPTANLALKAESGRYSLSGQLAIAQFLKGKGARLSAPRVQISGSATFADRKLDGRFSLRSQALKLEGAGIVDLATSSFANFRIGTDLLQPKAMFPNMTGSKIRLTLLLNGPFGTASFAYRLTSPHIAFDNTGFDVVQAEGHGRFSNAPVSVPIRLTARRVTGVGDVAGGILANLRVEGVLKVTAKQLTGENLALTSDKLKGKLSLLVDLVTGRYNVVISGGLTRYFIPGLGIVDVTTELKVVPGAGGHGTLITGRGHAWVRRFDNKFLAGLAGGLPQIETRLVRSADGVIHFQDLRLTAPAIRITGNGFRRRDGTFHFEGSGAQRQYGPLSLVLDGHIDRPKLTLRLQHPAAAAITPRSTPSAACAFGKPYGMNG